MARLAAGRIIANRYALKTSLGRGGTGVVWDAYDLLLGREVAVKEVVPPPTLPDTERRSAQARGPLPAERVAEIGAQVASTLAAAHRAGIVHRDVTPGNVMVPEAGTARLTDFGIASLQGDPRLTSTGLVIGSPAYMAPEQAKGEPSGPATDFWGLGATMYYAVEGEAPFDQGTPVATAAAVVNEEPRPMRRAGPLAPLLMGGLLVAWLANGIGAEQGQDRAAPATTQRGTGATGTTAQAVATTEEPATTHEPTTATTAALQDGLPAGWRAFTNRAGNNRVGVPPGFQARTRTSYHATVVEERHDPGRVFTVRSTTPANPLPQASRGYRAWARRNVDAFRELRYAEDQTYAGRDGAVVFEYETVRNGRRVHVSHINLEGRTWGYNVEFVAPADQWEGSKGLARQFEQAFTPLG